MPSAPLLTALVSAPERACAATSRSIRLRFFDHSRFFGHSASCAGGESLAVLAGWPGAPPVPGGSARSAIGSSLDFLLHVFLTKRGEPFSGGFRLDISECATEKAGRRRRDMDRDSVVVCCVRVFLLFSDDML